MEIKVNCMILSFIRYSLSRVVACKCKTITAHAIRIIIPSATPCHAKPNKAKEYHPPNPFPHPILCTPRSVTPLHVHTPPATAIRRGRTRECPCRAPTKRRRHLSPRLTAAASRAPQDHHANKSTALCRHRRVLFAPRPTSRRQRHKPQAPSRLRPTPTTPLHLRLQRAGRLRNLPHRSALQHTGDAAL
jgi:hypothetical protein